MNKRHIFLLTNHIKWLHLSRRTFLESRLTDFPVSYKPNEIEEKWYRIWEEKGYFKVKNDRDNHYTMILPPPNVTGTLHLGHALTTTVQDIIARWLRMKGDSVLWIPGLDHAGIATQAVVEKYLFKTKGIKRHDMSKDEFLSFIWKWNDDKGSTINRQLRKLGASLDWSQHFFTMSKAHQEAVSKAFITLYERDLLYREKDMINWSPSLCSGISDIEVDHIRVTGKTDIEIPGYKKKVTFGQIVDVAYELEDSDETIIVSTTRPETICGDVAIAVNPNHTSYSRYIGRFVKHPFKNSLLPIIADDSVSIEFGTGAMKVTPAHDIEDYRIANRHNLEIVSVIGEDGKMTELSGHFQGLPRYVARDRIIAELSEKGLLKSIRDHEMIVPMCSRTGDIIEYMLKEQWFLKCKAMAQLAINAVRDKSLRLDPPLYEEAWFSWLEGVKDWCLSRQLIWGHRIPAYQCKYENKSTWFVVPSEEDALKLAREKYGHGVKVEQDNDVLDTWFSSALLPCSVMGWPNQNENFRKFYPLSLLVTGQDILFFWAARMTMLGLELTNNLPFKELLLHGILCDANGKKMSKSAGNVISPENVINGINLTNLNKQAQESHDSGILSQKELKRTFSVNSKTYPKGIQECGADALRFTLSSLNVKNLTNSFNIEQCVANTFFCNKILQACKFTLRMTNEDFIPTPTELSTLDRWILSRLAHMVKSVNDALSEKSLNKATSAIKQFLYYEFCDYYIEGTKLGFQSNKNNLILAHQFALVTSLEVSLRILAPFTPFLADELYMKMSEKCPNFSSFQSLMEAPYPAFEELQEYENLDLEAQMNVVIDSINRIRSLLTDVNKKLHFEVHIVTESSEEYDMYSKNINVVKAVSKIEDVKILPSTDYVKRKNHLCDNTTPTCSIYLIVEDDAVFDDLKCKLEKRRQNVEKRKQNIEKKLLIKRGSKSTHVNEQSI